jgi:DNA end-binding protein Ku
MRHALRETNTYGIGEIAFSGREHLVGIAAPLDTKQKGLMVYTLRYTLRYEEELREPKSALSGVTESSVGSDELDLAKQLIETVIVTMDVLS